MIERFARPGWITLWLSGSVLLLALYAGIFFAGGSGPMAALRYALANVVPVAMLAALVHPLLKQAVMARPPVQQLVIHLAAAPLFALTWYALTLMTLALLDVLVGQPFRVGPFGGPALLWQGFQGLLVYALIAALSYAIRGGRDSAPVTLVADSPAMERYLVRADDGIAPMRVSAIIAITGAQDYSEVHTDQGTHLVRMSLGEFAERLDRVRFLRVHRSAIINFDRMERAEPAGSGKLLVWMDNGLQITASRTGSALLRQLVV
jgi:two-component system, LytTR family, response regulator